MSQWLLPTLSEILREADSFPPAPNFPTTLALARQRAEWGWSGAIVALGQLLQSQVLADHLQSDAFSQAEALNLAGQEGLILCGPLPLFTDPEVLRPFSNWIFIPDILAGYLHPPHLLPGSIAGKAYPLAPTPLLPLLPEDPLAMEQFCVALTPEFAVVLVIGDDRYGLPHFQFSFEATVLNRCCQALVQRIALTVSPHGERLAQALQRFPVKNPDFRVVSHFTRLLLDTVDLTTSPKTPDRGFSREEEGNTAALPQESPLGATSCPQHFADREDVELLQALAHEVRTPLATIRTLTQLLLKRQDLAPAVIQRLQAIDQECTEQIDRFGLIFRATELETTARSSALDLIPTALERVFQHSIPRWQKQADRRQLGLQVSLPDQLPTVLSDPIMLDQVLTGLVDRFIRHLPPQSQIYVTVTIAGEQLKLQLQSQLPSSLLQQDSPEITLSALADEAAEAWQFPSFSQQFQALGNLLLFQPETGRLSLNLEVTKNLFQAIGGKLIIREKMDRGEVLTVFLPLETIRDIA